MYKPWNIRHVDLSEGLPGLASDPEVQGVYLVFWWKDIPLGERMVAESQLPLPAARMTELAVEASTPAVGDHLLQSGFKAPLPVTYPRPDHDPPAELQALTALKSPLERFHERLSRRPEGAATVSVVVCTRERPERLRQCLDALEGLSEAPHEILVVDNAPRSDQTHRLVRQRPGIRYVLEARPGLSVARNTGARCSTGEIIAFTDDDVLVHPHWTIRLKQAFLRSDVLAVTGLVLPAELETEAQFLFQKGHSGFGRGFRALTFDEGFFEQNKYRGAPVWRIGAGANMAFRREVFDQVGLFDERLGAGAAGCSEDSEMWYRVIAEGGRCRYEPTAVVYHRHRADMEGLEHQMYQYMRGHVAALLVQYERYGHWGNLFRAFGLLPAYYGRLLLRSLRGRRLQAETLGPQIRGCAAGLSYYLKHQRRPPVSAAPSDVIE